MASVSYRQGPGHDSSLVGSRKDTDHGYGMGSGSKMKP